MISVNEVHRRAGMDYTAANVSTIEEFRKRLRNERRVELCFENQRYFDLRRWKAYEGVTVENEQVYSLTNLSAVMPKMEMMNSTQQSLYVHYM